MIFILCSAATAVRNCSNWIIGRLRDNMNIRIFFSAIILLQTSLSVMSQSVLRYTADKTKVDITTVDGTLTISPLTDNSVRVRFNRKIYRDMPELVYVEKLKTPVFRVKDSQDKIIIALNDLTVSVDRRTGLITYLNRQGRQILAENGRSLAPSMIDTEQTYIAEQHFVSPSDEHQYGLGQFQDGYLDVRGLSRRLTQVNTQISVPMILSNKIGKFLSKVWFNNIEFPYFQTLYTYVKLNDTRYKLDIKGKLHELKVCR